MAVTPPTIFDQRIASPTGNRRTDAPGQRGQPAQATDMTENRVRAMLGRLRFGGWVLRSRRFDGVPVLNRHIRFPEDRFFDYIRCGATTKYRQRVNLILGIREMSA